MGRTRRLGIFPNPVKGLNQMPGYFSEPSKGAEPDVWVFFRTQLRGRTKNLGIFPNPVMGLNPISGYFSEPSQWAEPDVYANVAS